LSAQYCCSARIRPWKVFTSGLAMSVTRVSLGGQKQCKKFAP
jgi:hypothetical protein